MKSLIHILLLIHSFFMLPLLTYGSVVTFVGLDDPRVQRLTQFSPANTCGNQTEAFYHGPTINLTFTGTGAAVIGSTHQSGGMVDFFIDGQKNATRNLYADSNDTACDQTLYQTPSLENGTHFLMIDITGESPDPGCTCGAFLSLQYFTIVEPDSVTGVGTQILPENTPKRLFAAPDTAGIAVGSAAGGAILVPVILFFGWPVLLRKKISRKAVTGKKLEHANVGEEYSYRIINVRYLNDAVSPTPTITRSPISGMAHKASITKRKDDIHWKLERLSNGRFFLRYQMGMLISDDPSPTSPTVRVLIGNENSNVEWTIQESSPDSKKFYIINTFVTSEGDKEYCWVLGNRSRGHPICLEPRFEVGDKPEALWMLQEMTQ